jgi:hypothetical protein
MLGIRFLMAPTSKWFSLLAFLALLHWLFGNLYEAIVISPNWVVESGAQLDRLHGFFVRTSPTAYFVPVSQLAPLLVWTAHFLNRLPAAAQDFRRASVLALVGGALNAFIVITIVLVIFGEDYRALSDTELHALCVRWNWLNAARMGLTAATAFWMFAAYRKLDGAECGSRAVAARRS